MLQGKFVSWKKYYVLRKLLILQKCIIGGWCIISRWMTVSDWARRAYLQIPSKPYHQLIANPRAFVIHFSRDHHVELSSPSPSASFTTMYTKPTPPALAFILQSSWWNSHTWHGRTVIFVDYPGERQCDGEALGDSSRTLVSFTILDRVFKKGEESNVLIRCLIVARNEIGVHYARLCIAICQADHYTPSTCGITVHPHRRLRWLMKLWRRMWGNLLWIKGWKMSPCSGIRCASTSILS